MKIETDDWLPLAEAARAAGIDRTSARRAAQRLGLLQEFFGVLVIRRADAGRITETLPRGNPHWIADGDAAAAAALRAVASRESRRRRPRT